MSTGTSMVASSEVYTQAEHAIYADQMREANDGLRRHIDNKAGALSERIDRLEQAHTDVYAIPSIRDAQTRIYDELRGISESVHELNAVNISTKLDGIQSTLREHGETLREHSVQLARHEEDIEAINRRAIADLRKDVSDLQDDVTELEKADGKKALKILAIVATAVISVLVGGVVGAMGLFGG